MTQATNTHYPLCRKFLIKVLSTTLFLFIVLALLLGCGPASTQETTTAWKLPTELEHCRLYTMKDDKGNKLRVVHCPNATTTTGESISKGKSGTEERMTVVIDNATYELVKKD